jgi:GT2 family glycosyltransferase
MNTQSVWSRVDVIVTIHNALELTKRCIGSVLRTRRAEEHPLILVDAGSAAETAEFLRGVAQAETDCDLLRSEHATGYTKATNRGLKACSAPMVVLLNSDREVPPRWLEKLQEVMFEIPGVGIVGPLSNVASYLSIPRQERNAKERLAGQTPINILPSEMPLDSLNAWLESNMPATPFWVPLVRGFCFAVRLEVIGDIGVFDEGSYPEGYGEEDDYCLRAVDAGWSLAVAKNTYVWHEKSGSYKDNVRLSLVEAGRRRITAIFGAQRRAAVISALREGESELIRIAGDVFEAQTPRSYQFLESRLSCQKV